MQAVTSTATRCMKIRLLTADAWRMEEFSWESRNRAFPQGNITCFVEREATLSNERCPAFLVFLKNTLSPKHAPLRDTQLQKQMEMHPNH